MRRSYSLCLRCLTPWLLLPALLLLPRAQAQVIVQAITPPAPGAQVGSINISDPYAVISSANLNLSYIYRRDGAAWVQDGPPLQPNDLAPLDLFGRGAGISGDYALIGAFQQDSPTQGVDAGAVYVFRRIGGVWQQQQKLVPASLQAGDRFGTHIRVSGAYAVIGADQAGTGGGGNGKAYVFHLENNAWVQQQVITASDGSPGDRFGFPVDIDGDLIGICASGFGTEEGRAYVFRRNGTTWIQEDILSPSTSSPDNHFAQSIGIESGYAIVGAPQHDDGGNADVGAVYIFGRDGVDWTERQRFLAPDRSADDRFGFSVAMRGDFAIAGAPGAASARGAMYMLTRSGTSWVLHQPRLEVTGGTPGNGFGGGTGISGTTAIVGSTPTAYVVNLSGGTATEEEPAGGVALAQNHPNPVADETRIAFSLPAAGPVRLSVFDALGREVAVLLDGTLAAGAHEARWAPGPLPAGPYLYRLRTDAGAVTRRLVRR